MLIPLRWLIYIFWNFTNNRTILFQTIPKFSFFQFQKIINNIFSHKEKEIRIINIICGHFLLIKKIGKTI